MKHKIGLLTLLISGALLAGCAQKTSDTVKVQVIGINDFHGALKAPGDGKLGGIESIATLVNQLRAQNDKTIVVGAGDLVGASPLLSSMFYDEPTIEALSAIGMETSAVGNHEFDKGKEELLRKQNGGCHPTAGCVGKDSFAGADFNYLAANVIVKETGETLFPSYFIKEFDGIPMAFIGLTLEGTPAIVTPSGTAGLEFKNEVETINNQVKLLKAQGINSIGVLIHEGATQQVDTKVKDINRCDNIKGPIVDIVNQLDGAVDFVVSGHTHQAYNCEINGKTVISAQSNGALLSQLNIEIDRNTKDIVSINAKNIPVETKRYEKNPELTTFVQRYEQIALPISQQVMGTLTESSDKKLLPAGDSTLGKIIADGQLYAASSKEAGGAQIAFMNSGGIRADLKAGELTYGDIFTVQPFSNVVVTQSLTGEQIKQALEQQWDRARPQVMPVSKGFYYEWDDSRPVGDKVIQKSMKLNGKPLDMKKSYRVAANEFLATGGSRFSAFNQGKDRVYSVPDNEALMHYFKDNSPVSVPTDVRIKKIN
ncbi:MULTISPECIES: bifunctional metallophosphatase/5'-nucleotidase [Providencia]|uniref:Bifunctional metallophosphatase/5'-nucleotidase n=3 Tax=Providencia TaxID=586 RepID=A0AAE3BYA6_PRORE|nr:MULTISPECIES: bifunctional metallophosphatase/5'-nucleotidase [Providencia]MBC8653393.1 bifunctional metallophosphatase/5'-nucleotidase [Providencia vermicola]EIL1984852.1 bifunctional metallophosphatase/5'-nucleotidase [Providencia rettgeri]EIU7557546.1 bifunctional metallophosphatase/5'-nucleotidase [Providencia rettgeri]EIU9517256.1 bifunctional metallophosphatase/5'-nucleotidase [Providencia rettgeri]EJD6044138.1 bifunctional metallophosphatase/5'-nucleotidase [Providencia rettgeri]